MIVTPGLALPLALACTGRIVRLLACGVTGRRTRRSEKEQAELASQHPRQAFHRRQHHATQSETAYNPL
jgi:hypothetical protein